MPFYIRRPRMLFTNLMKYSQLDLDKIRKRYSERKDYDGLKSLNKAIALFNFQRAVEEYKNKKIQQIREAERQRSADMVNEYLAEDKLNKLKSLVPGFSPPSGYDTLTPESKKILAYRLYELYSEDAEEKLYKMLTKLNIEDIKKYNPSFDTTQIESLSPQLQAQATFKILDRYKQRYQEAMEQTKLTQKQIQEQSKLISEAFDIRKQAVSQGVQNRLLNWEGDLLQDPKNINKMLQELNIMKYAFELRGQINDEKSILNNVQNTFKDKSPQELQTLVSTAINMSSDEWWIISDVLNELNNIYSGLRFELPEVPPRKEKQFILNIPIPEP